MGLMDNIKNAQEMAEQAQKMAAEQQAGGAAAMGAGGAVDVERMQWTNRVGSEGLDGEGTITSIKETGNLDGDAKEFEIKVDATVNGESVKATALQFLHPKAEGAYKKGARFELKADPDDTSKILLMKGLD